MSTSRPVLGTRPSSANASPRRTGVRWTPDFSAGAAGLELEAILNRLLLDHRALAVGSAALKLVARPEQVRDRRWAWAAVGLEVLGVAHVWQRTRTWESMLDPRTSTVDRLIGLAAVGLGSRSMHVEPQLDGSSWTNRLLAVHLAAVPVSDRRNHDLVFGTAAHLLPLVLGWPDGNGRRILVRSSPGLVRAVAESLLVTDRMRHHARVLDAWSLRWEHERLDDALAAEEERFATEVLAPMATALREVGELMAKDRPAATERARQEERRVRDWLTAPTTGSEAVGALDGVAADAGLRRLARLASGALRVSALAEDLVLRGGARTSRPSRRAAALVTGALAARAIVGTAVATEVLGRFVTQPTVRRLTTGADLVAATAVSMQQLADGHAAAGLGRTERILIEMSVSAAFTHGDAPRRNPIVRPLGALRAAVALSQDCPVPERLAAALNDVLIVATTTRRVRQVYVSAIAQADRTDAVRTAPLDDLPALADARLAHRSFVHDGPAQVLAAVAGHLAAAAPADEVLREWVERERRRVEARAGLATEAVEPLDELLTGLANEFSTGRLPVVSDVMTLPEWTDDVGPTVAAIVREALNNVAKHSASGFAWCGAHEREDGSVLVTVFDDGDDTTAFRPGSGVGTSTMQALAERIGADIEWFRTATGGTEVRLVLRPRRSIGAHPV